MKHVILEQNAKTEGRVDKSKMSAASETPQSPNHTFFTKQRS